MLNVSSFVEYGEMDQIGFFGGCFKRAFSFLLVFVVLWRHYFKLLPFLLV